MMQSKDFVEFARTLHEMGAVQVVAGDFQVTFAAPGTPEWSPDQLDVADPGADHAEAAKANLQAYLQAQYGSSG